MKLPLVESLMVVSCFLEDDYKKTRSDELGSLLGLMQIDSNGTTMDSAIMGDWEDSIEKVLNKKGVTEITSTEGFQAMILFLALYVDLTGSKDVSNLLIELEVNKNGTSFDSEVAEYWEACWEVGIQYANENKGENLDIHLKKIPSNEKNERTK